MTTTTPWQAVYDNTRTTGRADCGHTNKGTRVWLRTQTTGGNKEVWSVCATCATPNDYTTIDRNIVPRRTKMEYLGDKRIAHLTDE